MDRQINPRSARLNLTLLISSGFRTAKLTLVLMLCYVFAVGQELPVGPIASPIQVGAYFPGIIGPRDYGNPGFSGLVAMDYNVFLSADKYLDRNGNAVETIDVNPPIGPIPIDVEISGYLNALLVAYVSPEIEWLGNARYLGAISPLYATADVRASYSLIGNERRIEQNTGGFGDLLLIPLGLTWTLGEDKADITGAYLISAPTGRYETGADDNIGLGYWNHAFQLFAYYYPFNIQKATAIYLGNTFEVHSKVKDVDVKPGSRYSLEYGISQYVHPRWEIFLQGGHSWQVGEDSGNDVYWDASFKDQLSFAGGGVGFWPVPERFYTSLKYMGGYGQKQHFNTSFWSLQLLWVPWIKGIKNTVPDTQ